MTRRKQPNIFLKDGPDYFLKNTISVFFGGKYFFRHKSHKFLPSYLVHVVLVVVPGWLQGRLHHEQVPRVGADVGCWLGRGGGSGLGEAVHVGHPGVLRGGVVQAVQGGGGRCEKNSFLIVYFYGYLSIITWRWVPLLVERAAWAAEAGYGRQDEEGGGSSHQNPNDHGQAGSSKNKFSVLEIYFSVDIIFLTLALVPVWPGPSWCSSTCGSRSRSRTHPIFQINKK